MHVRYLVIVTLFYHYFYFFIPINVIKIIYLLNKLFLRMFINGFFIFYLLILNVYLCQFLMLQVNYVTNIFLVNLHIILFLFDLLYLSIYLDQLYQIQIQIIFLLYQIILIWVIKIVLMLFQIIFTYVIIIVNLLLNLIFIIRIFLNVNHEVFNIITIIYDILLIFVNFYQKFC
jgi:hypothetical protein